MISYHPDKASPKPVAMSLEQVTNVFTLEDKIFKELDLDHETQLTFTRQLGKIEDLEFALLALKIGTYEKACQIFDEFSWNLADDPYFSGLGEGEVDVFDCGYATAKIKIEGQQIVIKGSEISENEKSDFGIEGDGGEPEQIILTLKNINKLKLFIEIYRQLGLRPEDITIDEY